MRTNQLFLCSCSSPEHQLFLSFDDEYPWNDSVSITFHLASRPWYKRIWAATRYVFGYKCQFGHFDELLLEYDQVEEMRDSLNKCLVHMLNVKENQEAEFLKNNG